MKLLSLLIALALSGWFVYQSSRVEDAERARLWSDPGAIASRDLFWGSGSAERVPQGPFTFVEENRGGTSPKVVVTDARGKTWDVKFSAESHSEVAANRLMWAFGYPVQEMYYVHDGRIEGAKNLERADSDIQGDGTFWEARFKLRDPKVVKGEGWALANNPFVGTRELSGLVILFALTNNWDTDLDSNQTIYSITNDKGAVEQWYLADDVGASFGRFDLKSPIKWNLEEYRKDNLIAKADGDAIELNYGAYGMPPTRIPMEHARWFVKMAEDLTPAQVRRAFEAARTPPAQIDGFVEKFMSKLDELKAAVGGTL